MTNIPEDDYEEAASGTTLTRASPTQIAALQDLGVAAAQIQAAHPRGGGEPLLRMDKGTAAWVVGIDAEPLDEGTILAVNPLACQHGFVCWNRDPKAKGSKKLGEYMGPITKPKMDPTDLPDMAGGEWSDQIALSLRVVGGEDDGMQVTFKANSMGGIECCVDLIGKIGDRARSGSTEVVPHVELTHTSYQHPAYGTIHKPVLKIVRWTDLNGKISKPGPSRVPPAPADPAAAAATASPASEPVRRRRSA